MCSAQVPPAPSTHRAHATRQLFCTSLAAWYQLASSATVQPCRSHAVPPASGEWGALACTALLCTARAASTAGVQECRRAGAPPPPRVHRRCLLSVIVSMLQMVSHEFFLDKGGHSFAKVDEKHIGFEERASGADYTTHYAHLLFILCGRNVVWYYTRSLSAPLPLAPYFAPHPTPPHPAPPHRGLGESRGGK